jgi:hypothetical protein
VADAIPEPGADSWDREPASLPLFREIYLACKAQPQLVDRAVDVIERWPAQVASRVRAVPVPAPLSHLFEAAFRATGHAVQTTGGTRKGLGRRAQHEAVLAALVVVERTREIGSVLVDGEAVAVDRDRYPAGVFVPSRLRHERGNEHRSLHHFPGFQLRSRRTRHRDDASEVPSTLRHLGPAPRPDWPDRYTWHFESGPPCVPPSHWRVFDRGASRGSRSQAPDFLEELTRDLRGVLVRADATEVGDALAHLQETCDEVVRDHLDRVHAEVSGEVVRGLSALVFTRVWKLVTLRGAVHDLSGGALRDGVLREVLGSARYNPMDALFREMDARLDRLDADAAVRRALEARREELYESACWVVEALEVVGLTTRPEALLAFAYRQFGRNRNRPLYLAHNEIALPIADPSGRKDAAGSVMIRGAGWLRREVVQAMEPLWAGAEADDGLALIWTQIMAGYRGRVRGRRVRHFQTRLGCWPDIGEFMRMRRSLSGGLVQLARVLERARLDVVACRTTIVPPRMESIESHAEDGHRAVELSLSEATGGGSPPQEAWFGDELAEWADDLRLRALAAALELRQGRFAPVPTVPAGPVALLMAELLGPALTAPAGPAALRLAAMRLRLPLLRHDGDESHYQLARLAALNGSGGGALQGGDLVALDALVRAYCAPTLTLGDLDDELADALWLALLDLGREPEPHLVEDRRSWPDLLARTAAIGAELRRTTHEALRALENPMGLTPEDR